MESAVRLRLRVFGLHLLASCGLLTFVLGTLYVGWYRWPGWYLADASRVALVIVGVGIALGPLLTLVVAAPGKPRRELTRDIGVIAAVQVLALGYGSLTLWNGRPLYYAFSENVLQLVQSYDIEAPERVLAERQNPALAPHWYSLPRWIWAPLPSEPQERERIIASALHGGSDVIDMPRYFRPWEQGLPALRAQLQKLEDVSFISAAGKRALRERMRAQGLSPDQPCLISFTGRGPPMLAAFDPESLRLAAVLRIQ